MGKKPGESVTKGEILLQMEKEKVIRELEAPETGVLEEILVAEDEYAGVGAVLARIRVSVQDVSNVQQQKGVNGICKGTNWGLDFYIHSC
ncbi:hypothetical protein KFU94_55205 [Chloroflexi bacterium TSY]|nr:hypothetical protein [Chloroflexi bacterium TSY]